MSVGIKLQPLPKVWDPDFVAWLENEYRRMETAKQAFRRLGSKPVPDLTHRPISIGPFTSGQVRSLTGLTSRQVRYWRYVGIAVPSVQATGGKPGKPALYSAEDVQALRNIKALLDAGMSTQAVHKLSERRQEGTGKAFTVAPTVSPERA